MEHIFGMSPLDAVSFSAPEAVSIGRPQIEVGPFQLFVLFVVVDDVGYGSLLDEAPLVDGVFGEVGLDDVELA